MGFQSHESLNFRNLKIPIWESRTKWHLGVGPMARHREYYRGEGGGFPLSSGCAESCEFMFVRRSSVHQKCCNYALTNLLFGLCRFMWIIDLLVNLPSPHFGAPTHPSTPQVLQAKERVRTFSLSTAITFGLIVESIKELELGGASWGFQCQKN